MQKVGQDIFRKTRSCCHMFNISKGHANQKTGRIKTEVFNIVSSLRPERTVNLTKKNKNLRFCESKGQFKRNLRKEMLRQNYRNQAAFLSRYILGQKIFKERKGIIDDI